MKYIKTVMVLLLVLFLGIFFIGCVSQPPSLTKVKVAYQPTSSNGPLYIAKDEGFFSRQGIDVEFVKTQSSSAAIPLLVSGDVDVSTGPLKTGLINTVAKGEHIRIVADKGTVTPGSCVAYALMVRKDLYDSGMVRNVSDLRGRKIVVRDEGYDLFRVLALGNLSSTEVEKTDMDFTMIVPSFTNGGIDAALVTEPYITLAQNSGSAVVLVPAQEFLPQWPLPLYYGHTLLDRDPDLGRRFMIAYLEGVKEYNKGKTERNLAILGNYTGLDRDLLNQTCWYPVAGDGYLSEWAVKEYMEWMYENKKVKYNLTPDELIDMSYVDYVNSMQKNTTPGS